MKCKICGKEIEGYGNNAMPVYPGRCCDSCNYNVVIPRRIQLANKYKEKKDE